MAAAAMGADRRIDRQRQGGIDLAQEIHRAGIAVEQQRLTGVEIEVEQGSAAREGHRAAAVDRSAGVLARSKASTYVVTDTPEARALEQFGHKWEAKPEEIGAANALVFNPDGTVTAVSENHRHGVGTALVQKRGH